MGGALSRFKSGGGGGFLSNVDATISGYTFTTKRPMSKVAGPVKSSDFTPLFVRAEFKVDGAKDAQETSLMAGDGSQWRISKNGHIITPLTEEARLWGGVDFHTFLTTLVKPVDGGPGYDEANFPAMEPGEPITFACLIGERVRLVQKVDEVKTAKLGKRRDPKTGKEYDRTYLAVAKYYGTAQTTAAKHGKPNGNVADDTEVAELAAKTLANILLDASGSTIKYADLKIKTMTALAGNALRDPVYTYLSDKANLGTISGIVYYPATGVIGFVGDDPATEVIGGFVDDDIPF